MQISALVPEIFKFEKWKKYVNEMTDDITHSTQYYIEYVNRAALANLQCRTLKLGRLIVLTAETTPTTMENCCGNSLFSNPHTLDFNI